MSKSNTIKVYKVTNGWIIEETANFGELTVSHVAEKVSTLLDVISYWASEDDERQAEPKITPIGGWYEVPLKP